MPLSASSRRSSRRAAAPWQAGQETPEIPAPVAVTARIVHTNIDLEQNVAAGLSFDFAFNPEHRAFVVSVFADYADRVQRRQLAKMAG